MINSSTLFSSKARTSVLRVLSHQTTPLTLRHIHTLTESPLFSVQRVLHQLAQENLVVRKKIGEKTLFSLNAQHEAISFLKEVFQLETQKQILASSSNYDQKAKETLEFSSDAFALVHRGRS